MHRFFSRLVTILIVALAVPALPAHAAAQAVPHFAKGGAQFTGPNDFIGFGNATHLGSYTEVGHVTFAPTSNPDVLAVKGVLVYTAANTDELHAAVSGELNLRTGAITATVTYVGGTGRFVSASGSANLIGQMLGGGAVAVTVSGIIEY
jgi:hypothetical protein